MWKSLLAWKAWYLNSVGKQKMTQTQVAESHQSFVTCNTWGAPVFELGSSFHVRGRIACSPCLALSTEEAEEGAALTSPGFRILSSEGKQNSGLSPKSDIY